MWKGFRPRTRPNDCIPDRIAVFLHSLGAEGDQPAALLRKFTVGRYIRTDDRTAGDESLSDRKSEAFGQRRRDQGRAMLIAPLKLCVVKAFKKQDAAVKPQMGDGAPDQRGQIPRPGVNEGFL